LEYALIFLSHGGCVDPRDKVYGLMALVRPSHRLEVDYDKSAVQVYKDVVVKARQGRYTPDAAFFDYMDSLCGDMGFTVQQQEKLKRFTRRRPGFETEVYRLPKAIIAWKDALVLRCKQRFRRG
jgi:hypothetical protein